MSASEARLASARTFAPESPRAALSVPWLIAIAALLIVLRAVPHLVPFIGPWPLEPGNPVDFGFRFVAYVLWGSAALLALSRESTIRLGWLLVAITAADAIWALQFIALPAFYFITDSFQGLSSVVLGHILVSFPSGRLTSQFDRRFVSALYAYFFITGVLRLLMHEPGFVCAPGEYCPANPFAVLQNRDFVRAMDLTSPIVVPLIGLAVMFAVLRHWRAAGPVARRILRPLVVVLPLNIAYNTAWFAAQNYEIEPLQAFLQLPFINAISWVLPGAFLLGILRARNARAGLPAALVGVGRLPTTAQLQSVLRDRLGDPALRVVRWSPTIGAYIDGDGEPVGPIEPGAPQRLIELARDGEPVAGVVLDATLDDPGLESTVSSLIGLTVDATDLRDELRAHGGDAAGLPTGEVTFLFGDIESSTRLLESLGEAYAGLLTQFRASVVDVTDAHGGRVVDARADELFCVFRSAAAAAASAIDLQRRIARASWPEGATVRVRIGLHTGTPALTATGYIGIDVHRAARVMAAASGGQILASGAVAARLDPEDAALRSLGPHMLRGLTEPIELVEIVVPGVESAG